MKGYPNLIHATEPVAFRLTSEERAWLRKTVRSLGKEGDLCQADVLRVAFTRLMGSAKKRSFRRELIAQILTEKGRGNTENTIGSFEAARVPEKLIEGGGSEAPSPTN